MITRRDFLKLAGMLPLSIAAPKLVSSLPPLQTGKQQNVIIIVFDALSAYNISLYGYERETTPNLARLADRAIVYHKHYAGGNFTTPGTASLLTGTLPWTHRAFSVNEEVDDAYVDKNVFSAFHNYHRLAYTHNPLVSTLLRHFGGDIDDHIRRNTLFLKHDFIIPTIFKKDEDVAFIGWLRAMRSKEDGYAYSLFLSRLVEQYDRQLEAKLKSLKQIYPRGVPKQSAGNYFLLETAIDWFNEKASSLPQPFLSYLHFFPPHDPYRTHHDFHGQYKNDGWNPVPKEKDVLLFGTKNYFRKHIIKERRHYDEFILYVDREFGKLFDNLERLRLLDNTWVILTSDHGEMFERGVLGHRTPLLYEPVIRIPLMIFEPGRKTRLDIHTSTSAVDLLPTLLHVTDQQPVNWTEGRVLPPFSNATRKPSRNIYVLEARNNSKYAPFTEATTVLVKGNYKLMYFFGYEELGSEGERIELYDLGKDPEELNDLSLIKRETTAELLNELKGKLAEVNEPYQ
ncbi:MAG: sulfatase-like hydrolase/transferase [Anaerolineae bacterium]|nr:sulfatase-like hydrolase/transferase [Anaerolineae bacterium]